MKQIIFILGLVFLCACSKMEVNPQAVTLDSSLDSNTDLDTDTPTPNPTPGNNGDIPNAKDRSACKTTSEEMLRVGFSKSYWPFLKANCVACHGDSGSFGGSGPKFASATLSQAFDAFYAVPETNVIRNALNWDTTRAKHGTPTTNGMFHLSTVKTAAATWAQAVDDNCKVSTNPTPNPTPTPAPTPTIPVPSSENSSTVGLLTQVNLLPTYKVYTGVAPSVNTITRFYDEFPGKIAQNLAVRKSRKFLLPPTSDVDNLTSGSMLITALMATEHCNDLIDAESKTTARTFFLDANSKSIDLAAQTLTAVTEADVMAVVKQLARRLWQREATAAELAVYTQHLSTLKTQNLTTRQGMLLICTVSLSSLSANAR